MLHSNLLLRFTLGAATTFCNPHCRMEKLKRSAMVPSVCCVAVANTGSILSVASSISLSLKLKCPYVPCLNFCCVYFVFSCRHVCVLSKNKET